MVKQSEPVCENPASLLSTIMRQPKVSEQKLFVQNPDYLSFVDRSFRLLKRIRPTDSSKVDPLAPPISGKVGLSLNSSFKFGECGIGCLENKNIPLRPPELDLPPEFTHPNKPGRVEDSRQTKSLQSMVLALLCMHSISDDLIETI